MKVCSLANGIRGVVLGAAAVAVTLATVGPASATLIGSMQTHTATFDDTFIDLARQYNLGYVEIALANREVDPWLPGEGTEISVPRSRLLPDAPREGIVINLAEMRLYFFPEVGGNPMTFPVGIGREGRQTPTGTSRIVRRAADPTWYPPQSIRAERPELPGVVPPGPDNPLGEHALYLDWPAYLIHGTNRPEGIGRRASAGCIRMYPEDVAKLFEIVPDNALVTIVDQEVKMGWDGNELYVEVNPSQGQADEIEVAGQFEPRMPSGLVTKVMRKAGNDAHRVDMSTLLRIGHERPGYPIRVTR